MACGQNSMLYGRWENSKFYVILVFFPPLDFTPLLKTFRTLNIKEFFKTHVNTFWVEKLTQDRPLFTHYEQEHAWLCEDYTP